MLCLSGFELYSRWVSLLSTFTGREKVLCFSTLDKKTDYKRKNPVELPRAYTRQEIPPDTEQIPTPEIVNRIEHLKEIASEIPVYDPELEIGLLIGSNCSNALIPLSVVRNEGDGPFAWSMKLKHGWTVSGPLHLTSEPFTNRTK